MQNKTGNKISVDTNCQTTWQRSRLDRWVCFLFHSMRIRIMSKRALFVFSMILLNLLPASVLGVTGMCRSHAGFIQPSLYLDGIHSDKNEIIFYIIIEDCSDGQ